MQYENNRVDPARADELALEILYGNKIPASEALRIAAADDARNDVGRRLALGALQRGNARRILTTEEQENIQAGTQQSNPKRTSGRTSF